MGTTKICRPCMLLIFLLFLKEAIEILRQKDPTGVWRLSFHSETWNLWRLSRGGKCMRWASAILSVRRGMCAVQSDPAALSSSRPARRFTVSHYLVKHLEFIVSIREKNVE